MDFYYQEKFGKRGGRTSELEGWKNRSREKNKKQEEGGGVNFVGGNKNRWGRSKMLGKIIKILRE